MGAHSPTLVLADGDSRMNGNNKDIVAKLRQRASHLRPGNLYEMAADEIERLRARLDRDKADNVRPLFGSRAKADPVVAKANPKDKPRRGN